MNEVLSIKSMYTADKATISAGTDGFTLMKNAGQGIADHILATVAKTPTLVLCGPGNNGGDGFIIASELKKAGWPIRVASLTQSNKYTGDALRAVDAWQGDIGELSADIDINSNTLIIDALFGIGLSKPLPTAVIKLFKKIKDTKCIVFAVDIPSGIDGDTGSADPATLNTQRTYTFCRKKTGHLLLPGKSKCGDVTVIDIGITDKTIKTLAPHIFENTPDLWLPHYQPPQTNQHKYDRGHAVTIGGAKMTGASYMAAYSALRTGAGLSTICSPAKAFDIYASYSANLMIEPFNDNDPLFDFLKSKKNACFLIGPGLGKDEPNKQIILQLLSLNRPTILDADALSIFQNDPQTLFDALHEKCILTPHTGEFSRIFGRQKANGSKLITTQQAAKKAGCTIVFKGSDTVIASPNQQTVINTNAPPTLASAGTGDVLAGIILGFICQKMPPFEAACAGTYLHGQVATEFGIGLIAEDLISGIPSALKFLLKSNK